MRLSLLPLASSPHKDSVIAVGWSSSNELYSCSEDHTIWRWSRNAEALSKIYTCTESFTELRWYPWISQRHRGGSGGDVFAVGFRDGAFCIINKGGREERRIEAHKGAVLSLQWNFEGTLLATGGEDGFVKVWSRNGMLRTNVCQNEQVVSALAWAPDSNYILFSSGKSLVIKHIQSSSKHIQWESHEGLVVQVDWNHANNIIVSIGEEGFYKVWDCFGSLSFMGENINARLTSVAWCPSGELFVIGAHNLIVLCDKSGRILSKEKPEVGTLKTLAWSMDGSQLAMGSSNGTVLVGHLIGWRVECLRQMGTSVGSNHVQIQDYLDEKVEELEFRDFIINMCLGFGHLIVTTTSQCLIYSIGDWRAPRIIDIKGIAMILLQSALCFCVGDFSNGLQLFNYEGRKLSNPSVLGLRVELLNKQNVSLSKDMLAMVDCSDPKTLIFLDTTTGKVFGNGVHHAVRIVEIGLNQQGARADRILTFIDSNYDLYITPILKTCVAKLASMTSKMVWSREAHIIAAMVDQNLIIWYYPQAIFIDVDLLRFLKIKKECFMGKNATIHDFQGSRCNIQYEDGSFVFLSLSPTPYLLFEYLASKKWEQAIKLCWLFKEMSLWASVAAAAMDAKEFPVAEQAYTALDQADKVQFINDLKNITSEVVRQAEYAMFRRQFDDAESILLHSGLIYRAIKMNIRLFQWDRALELARLHKRHIDTVLWQRQKYLLRTNQRETKDTFLHLIDQVHIDVEKIKHNIVEEKDHERNFKDASKEGKD